MGARKRSPSTSNSASAQAQRLKVWIVTPVTKPLSWARRANCSNDSGFRPPATSMPSRQRASSRRTTSGAAWPPPMPSVQNDSAARHSPRRNSWRAASRVAWDR